MSAPNQPLQPASFPPGPLDEYTLLDSGEGWKLERFGPRIVSRPDPQALWKRKLAKDEWRAADLVFERRRGEWVRITLEGNAQRGFVSVLQRKMNGDLPDGWQLLAKTEQDIAGIRLGGHVDLKVVANRRSILVSVAGRELLRATLAKGSLAGRYGVGGPFANHVAWRKVRLR